MNADGVVVLRDLPVDPLPRVLGPGPVGPATVEAFPPPPPPPPPRGASNRSVPDRIAAARDDGVRRGRDEAHREAAAAFDEERAEWERALAAARSETEAAVRAGDADRREAVATAREDARRAAAADELRRAIDGAAAAAREALLDDALVLAYEATARFVGDAANADDAATRRHTLRALVAQAATELGGRALLRVRLHPDDVALLQEHPESTWTTVADAEVGRGGCRLETAHGGLDARLATRFDRLRSAWSNGGAA